MVNILQMIYILFSHGQYFSTSNLLLAFFYIAHFQQELSFTVIATLDFLFFFFFLIFNLFLVKLN